MTEVLAPTLPQTESRTRRRAALLAALLAGLIAALALGHWGFERARTAALAEVAQRGENTLHLAVSALRGQLRRFDRLPRLIAQQPVIHALLRAPDDPARVEAANRYLKATAELLDASDVYVMALDGLTLAASNFDTPISFVGGNFAFRPYFQDALTEGGAGRFYALGTTSLVRGYYFGAPILVDGAVAGVLVFKVDLDSIEGSWGGATYQVIVTDPEDIIFMSSNPDWTFAAIRPPSPERSARTQATRRYANATVGQLPLIERSGPAEMRMWEIALPEGPAEYLVLSEPMPDADWTVHVLSRTDGARLSALTLVAAVGFLAGIAVLAAVVVWQRRARLAERLALQAAAQTQLERRVAERTSELAAVNSRLEDEVAERRTAEARLRATQADLVQAAKLAALGQMSAALSHEYNQPLGAARNFAENAQTLIDRGRIDEARANIARILSLVERMGTISKHLSNFARKPNARLVDVPLDDTIAAAREIVDWRLRAAGVSLIVDTGPEPLVLRAGLVRMQQVLVNILSNAIDALEGRELREIRITARRQGDRAQITIRDTGTGVPTGLQDRIFDPFFSTKDVGKGLGLGLSISFNIVHDFGGTLSVGNDPGGGAVFTLDLPLWQQAISESA